MDTDLQGIVVIAVEQAVAAPYASSRLADAGARVIKVERQDGDFARHYDASVRGLSAYFVWLNRGKESVCLDLKCAVDRELLARMLAQADIFIQNLRPGILDKVGFGSAAVRARHPSIVTCDITGFGTIGPLSHLKAYDLIIQAESGLCSITGNAAGPARVGVSVCDIAAGMTAHAAILQALLARERHGSGRSIHVCLFDSIADWMNVPLLQYLYAGHEVARAGVAHPTIAPYGAFRCNDDVQVICAVQNDREWLAFCERFLRMPELVRNEHFRDNMARVVNRESLDLLIGEVFAQLASTQAMERLQDAGLAYGRVNTVREAAMHSHLRFTEIETPMGEVRIIAPAAVTGEMSQRLRAVPALGQHTESVRAEFATSGPAPSKHDAPSP